MAANRPISSLFVSPWDANPRFAIEKYDSMFCRAGIELSGGDPGRVHLAFASLNQGRPYNLPEAVNVLKYDFLRANSTETEALLQYVRRHRIEFVQILDCQIIHPLVAKLRNSGARTIISYWGAPISGPQPRWKYLLKRLRVKLARSRLDGLIFESQAMAKLATHDLGAPCSLVDVASVLGLEADWFVPADPEYVYRFLGYQREVKVIIYSGHVIRRKGIHVLIRAAMELLLARNRKDVAFLICGNRNGDSQEFESMYAGRGLESLIRFAGYRRDLREIFNSAFCGVIPTVGWESFTRSSLEMAACGLPIIASRLQGLAEAVVDGVSGLLFTPGNAIELADMLEGLLDQPERAAALGRAGRTRCEREFTQDQQFRRYLDVLERRLALSA